ncbi:MAG: 2-phospho-L-lactate transferase [Rhodospirillaceae bacterium]|jgi:LPPG:FO 2-phospho-L-lactate transferase|nr:2-phospho-L-lactate transferase [Rhodospirillaceae bacterium]MBT5195783.1 2-phospho-L-lactate transferase [Rhodospirillaceae bacterium]MBT5898199.1 2-phospho-L-lactate transferase [Rhodospirillaceae bacterium]MBT7757561.1 2-phospho-L-lactate transferase [Rhodospirillaceae bacterium]
MGQGPVIALSGGVGGAKLALGLSRLDLGDELLIVANVGDDFEHLGLTICPDLDTVTYTLSGLSDQEKGWGRTDEGWRFMESLGQLGGEDWFNLGDRDLALHIMRTQALRSGESLTAVTRTITRRLGIAAPIVPMTDDPVRTMVQTADGPLAFQHYFVRDRCEPVVTGFDFTGINNARPQADFKAALSDPDLQAIVITPSNPFVSVDPILNLPGIRDTLRAVAAPVVAVSPIVAGLAIKGPAAKMMHELGMPTTALAVAEHYGELLDGFVLDHGDGDQANAVAALGVRPLVTKTVMESLEDRENLAREVLGLARDIGN